MTTLLAPPAVSFPTKGPMGWSETSTADTSSKSSISAPTATPTHAPMASTAEDTMTAESQGIPMQTASTQTDNEVLSRATSHAANRANDRNYLQGQAEKPGQESDLDSSPLKPKQGAASHYLRRAEAHELPSFGNVGLANPEAAGAAAASLAHASAKPVEIWKPDPISAAGAAACLAHASPKRVEPWKPTQGTGAGKAARHALEDNNDRITPLTEPQPPERWSLTGTQGSMKVCRAGPSSTLQHDSGTEISGNALTTAPPAHMPMVRRASNAVEPAFEQPVENDLNNAGGVSQQERRKSDILRAATISMVKRNCDTHSPDSPRHRVPSPGRQRPAAPPSSRHQIYGPDLDEAACKVAAARLALIGYDPKRSASLLEAKGAQASLSRSRSVIAEDASDHSVAQRTDGNPSRSHDNLARLENKKRGENAVLLMAAAQRNVQAQMSGLDRQIADSKGLVRREDWEARARELAQASHDKRQHQNQGMVSIGGGGYMTQEEIDAIAARNVRPVLDEMTRKAEAERARVSAEKTRAAEERMELEEKKRLQEVWREREKETQEELRRAQAMGKEEGKCRKGQEKRHQKERRHSFRTESKRAKGSNSNNNIQPLQLLAPIVSNSNSNSDDHAPITPPTSPKEEKGLRGLINKFRVRRLSRNARRTSSKEPSSVGATAITKNYPSTNCNTAPSRDPNIPPPSALQTNGSQTPTTTPTLTEVALLGAPPPAPTARLPRNPPHTSSPVSSLHSFQCRGETVLEVHISDDDGSGDAAHNGYSNSSNNPQRRKGEDTRNHSNGAEEHNTFPGTPPALAALNLSGEQLPLEREASAGEPGNRSSIGSKFFENL